jgi:hypothetical protein
VLFALWRLHDGLFLIPHIIRRHQSRNTPYFQSRHSETYLFSAVSVVCLSVCLSVSVSMYGMYYLPRRAVPLFSARSYVMPIFHPFNASKPLPESDWRSMYCPGWCLAKVMLLHCTDCPVYRVLLVGRAGAEVLQ